jgi:hypothetical protein
MNEIKANYDETWKEITASAETEKRHADKLFQVWLKDNQEIWLLIHIEVQSQYDKEFPKRMFIYNYRAFDLYNKPVISLAILGDENKSWYPNSYQYGMENSELNFKFSTVKLLDYKWEELEENNNVFAIVVMAHLKTKATNSNLSLREQWKINLSKLLYERGYNKKEIADLLKVIDLMMSLPPELQISFEEKLTNYQEKQKMPLLMNIEKRALVRGEEKGAKKTRQQDIIDILESRFSNLPESLIKSIQEIDDLALLKKLILDTIKVNSLSEFEQLINNN